MNRWVHRALRIEWLPTVAVLMVVLLAGSRLIYLSVQQHRIEARQQAVAVAADYARKLDSAMQALVDPVLRRSITQRAGAAALIHDFHMTSNNEVRDTQGAPRALAVGIAQEWRAAGGSPEALDTSLLGPVRIGSQWFLAVRSRAVEKTGWQVAYAAVDEMYARAGVSGLLKQGYDFELSQYEPRSARRRIFLTSSSAPLTDQIDAPLHLPAPPVIPQSYLKLAVQLHGGWYPLTLLMSEIALLGFLAWLSAFGVHEIGHTLQRSSEILAAARQRLRISNRQLAQELRDRMALQQTFEHARFHDAFTGLPNRRYFMDQVDRALRDVRIRQRQRIAVILIDISRFRLINDLLGHTAGDELMVQAARRFETGLTGGESVLARWSGDQFAVLLPDVGSPEAAVAAAGRLQEEIRAPIELRRNRLVVSAAAGVTCVDSGQRRAEDVVRE